MRIDELTPVKFHHAIPTTFEQATSHLKDMGWERVGQGYFSEVFSKPGIDYVVKLFERDSAYLAYLRLISTHHNRHFPVLRGKFFIRQDINMKYNAVRMEKLYPVESVEVNGFKRAVSTLLSGYIDNLSTPNDRPIVKLAEIYLSDKPELKEALDLIDRYLVGRFKTDLTRSNVMARADGTVVIIDPLYE